jgi:hypothetical protein
MGNVACCSNKDASRGSVPKQRVGTNASIEDKKANPKRQSVMMKSSEHK